MSLIKAFVWAAVWGHALYTHNFLINLWSLAFHNKPLTLLWPPVPWILSTKFPYGPRICTSQLAGVAIVVSMLLQQLLQHYAAKMCGGRCSAIKNGTCYYWACTLAPWQRVYFYQPVESWFWNCPRRCISVYFLSSFHTNHYKSFCVFLYSMYTPNM